MRGKKRDIGGIIKIGEFPLRWSVKSEPIWKSTDGDIGLRLSVVRHGTPKAWRELILQFPFEKPKHASRFPERPDVTPEKLTAAISIAMEAGWEPHSRGRAMELILEEGDI